MERTLKVNAPAIVGEVIDGEAVIMNLASGHYFSAQGSGAVIWSSLDAGVGRSAICDRLARLYDVDRAVLDHAVGRFIDELLERELIVETDEPSGVVITEWPGDRARGPFDEPSLSVYSDMEELLLLDPIHDVHDAGWPTPRPPDAPET